MSGWSPLGGSPRGTLGRRVKEPTSKRKGRGGLSKSPGEIGHTVAEADKKVSLRKVIEGVAREVESSAKQDGRKGKEVEELRLRAKD